MIRRFFLQKKFSYKEEVYEHLCKQLAEDPVIKVPEFQGIFVVDCRSDLFKMLLMNKQYEPSLVKLVLKYLDDERDVIDVGANIGFYTILFAKRTEKRGG
ncbi:hypothetical protein M1N62_02480 [Thermodesulfovibrionales bacterium]|nr:hypothetical protein [Thermodesulfovibrionales bacterium]